MGGSVKNLIEICSNRKMVYIQTHNYPDPDAIASAYGLQYLLNHFGIESKICYVGRNDKLNTRKIFDAFDVEIFAYDDIADEMTDDDYIICVDSQKNGGNISELKGNEIATIDHHPIVNKYDYLYKDIRITGACASIITEYIKESNISISTEVATLLLYGIKMDTLGLTRGVSELDIQMFYYLFLHASHELISRLEKNTLEFADLKAFREAIDTIDVIDDVGFASIDFACDDAIIAIVSDFMLSVTEINVAIIYCYREDGIKFSVRSELVSVDAGTIVREALMGVGNGGGHTFMAGGLIPKENICILGEDPNIEIKSRFINVLNKIGTITVE